MRRASLFRAGAAPFFRCFGGQRGRQEKLGRTRRAGNGAETGERGDEPPLWFRWKRAIEISGRPRRVSRRHASHLNARPYRKQSWLTRFRTHLSSRDIIGPLVNNDEGIIVIRLMSTAATTSSWARVVELGCACT
ncbi:MAG TPA: hypothetical protein VIU82_01335 [Bosea sp. (in: a-proteobacteria)]